MPNWLGGNEHPSISPVRSARPYRSLRSRLGVPGTEESGSVVNGTRIAIPSDFFNQRGFGNATDSTVALLPLISMPIPRPRESNRNATGTLVKATGS